MTKHTLMFGDKKQIEELKRANAEEIDRLNAALLAKDAEINVLKAQFDNDAKRDKTILEENLYLLKDRDEKEAVIKALVEAGKGYLGNGCEPSDGDIVHVPEHCRQCRLEAVIALVEGRKG